MTTWDFVSHLLRCADAQGFTRRLRLRFVVRAGAYCVRYVRPLMTMQMSRAVGFAEVSNREIGLVQVGISLGFRKVPGVIFGISH